MKNQFFVIEDALIQVTTIDGKFRRSFRNPYPCPSPVYGGGKGIVRLPSTINGGRAGDRGGSVDEMQLSLQPIYVIEIVFISHIPHLGGT
jgi:hypothetical protein